MRFGGHETFHIREGWLHKGLNLLKDGDDLAGDDVADALGVGRNMAKSIKHWLLAAALAHQSVDPQHPKKKALELSDIGNLLLAKDPYFLEVGTWWTVHINLVNNDAHAAAWYWFFNHFNLVRFDRALCVNSIRQYLQVMQKRQPQDRTIERDVACLLASYARKIPPDEGDPEESLICPLSDLGLLTYFRDSGHYQQHRDPKPIPLEVLGYCLACAFPDTRIGKRTADVKIRDATVAPGAPGRAFSLTSEALFDVISRYEGDIEIAGHAGDRVVRMKRKKPLDWLKSYYVSLRRRGKLNAA